MSKFLKYDDTQVVKYDSVILAVIYTIGHILIAIACNRIITGATLDMAAADAFIEPIINGFWFYLLLVYVKTNIEERINNNSITFISNAKLGIYLAIIYTIGHILIAMTCNRLLTGAPLNLAAIDEFKDQKERMDYLDSQHEDVEKSLETLETAIRKIDKETRTKFKETFDKVDAGFKELFPKLFGGGHAYLELTGEDLLDTGVSVMARPPGKRNSSIQLLSGGEKALTAVAMVFSIFQLNPAPFCMLDEVDAPLDDANVARYCKLVQEMSQKVQFIFITHNKVTMQVANQLSGVTMQEPGVSRLVSVDVEEAAAMAAV